MNVICVRSYCAEVNKILFVVRVIEFTARTMSMFSDSSTDDETPTRTTLSGIVRLQSSNRSSVGQPATSTPIAEPSSAGTSSGEVQQFLVKIVDALLKIPSDPVKGVSIVKVKKYLKNKFGIRKDTMTKMLKATLEEAIARNVIIKSTAKNRVLLGSIQLSPGYGSILLGPNQSHEQANKGQSLTVMDEGTVAGEFAKVVPGKERARKRKASIEGVTLQRPKRGAPSAT